MSEYDTDIALWSEHQAALLRRRASGELVNDAAVDWHNIAEEIESLGRSERSAIKRGISTIIEHLCNPSGVCAGAVSSSSMNWWWVRVAW